MASDGQLFLVGRPGDRSVDVRKISGAVFLPGPYFWWGVSRCVAHGVRAPYFECRRNLVETTITLSSVGPCCPPSWKAATLQLRPSALLAMQHPPTLEILDLLPGIAEIIAEDFGVVFA